MSFLRELFTGLAFDFLRGPDFEFSVRASDLLIPAAIRRCFSGSVRSRVWVPSLDSIPRGIVFFLEFRTQCPAGMPLGELRVFG